LSRKATRGRSGLGTVVADVGQLAGGELGAPALGDGVVLGYLKMKGDGSDVSCCGGDQVPIVTDSPSAGL
jgi:hypothetical protein